MYHNIARDFHLESYENPNQHFKREIVKKYVSAAFIFL
jgi:hypothetical protein